MEALMGDFDMFYIQNPKDKMRFILTKQPDKRTQDEVQEVYNVIKVKPHHH